MVRKPWHFKLFTKKILTHIFTLVFSSTIVFCIYLSLLSIPQAFAQSVSSNSTCTVPITLLKSPPQQQVSQSEIQITPTANSPLTATPTPSSGLNPDILFKLVNNYRKQLGLIEFQKDLKTCKLATDRAPEIYNEIYVTHTMHKGMYDRNLPYWNTENIISMNSEQNAFNWWINDPIHREAIVGNSLYSCVACSGNTCDEEFTSYLPK